MRQPLVLAGVLAAVAACGGDRKMIAIGPPPAKATTGALAGPLCTGQSCTCAATATDPGAPEDAKLKRFEFRLGPTPHDLWATVAGRILYKSPERPEMCFYLDLPTGQHPVELRASQDAGVSAAITVREIGEAAKTAYDTFHFSCGSPGGVCSFEELDGKKAEYQGVKKGAHDPCGSTKVRGVVWDTGLSPDRLVPGELAMRFVLQIYKFQPGKAHGDPTCGPGDRRRDDGEPEAEGDPGADPAALPPDA